MKLKNEKELSEIWTTTLPDIYYDYNAARATDSFKRVFSKGNPELKFMFADLAGDKLVFIYMLHAFCLDVNSGKLLWDFRL